MTPANKADAIQRSDGVGALSNKRQNTMIEYSIDVHGTAASGYDMTFGFMTYQWTAAIAVSFMLATVAPAAAQTQPPPGGTAAQDKPAVEVVPQLGHTLGVTSVAVSPDGKTALSGGPTMKLWETATGRQIREFKGHSNHITSVAFSPDGKTALSGSQDNTLRLWDIATGRAIQEFKGHSNWVMSVAFAPDGKTVLSGSTDNTLRLWDLATGRVIHEFKGHSNGVWSVAISPDNKTALSGSWDKTLKLWDLTTGSEIREFKGHSDNVKSVAFSPGGKTVLSGSDDKTLKLWDLATGREIREFTGHSSWVAAVAISPDGKTILSGSTDQTLKLWELATGREIRGFAGHSQNVTSVAFSPDNRTALSGGWDKTLKLWDLATGGEIREFRGRSGWVVSAAISPDGKAALSGGPGETLKLWDLATGRLVREFDEHPNWETSIPVSISPDGKTALSGGFDNTQKSKLKLWELATGRLIMEFEGHSNWIKSVTFAPDGKTALSGSSDNTLRLWDLASGREIKQFSAPDGVGSAAISPDGRTALSGSDLIHSSPSVLKLWDLAAGRVIREFKGEGSGEIVSVAFAPDGRTALSCSAFWPILWDLATGRKIREFNGHSGRVKSAVFAPDGKTALSGDTNGTLILWDLATGREIRRFKGHSDWVSTVTFFPNGTMALSAGFDGAVRIWDLQRGKELAAMFATPGGESLAITPDGFYSTSHRDTSMLAIVRGLEVTNIGQVYQSLFNPDMVREALANDPDGEVKEAAKVINLEKILDSGPSPAAAITSHTPGSRSSADLVTVTARITDRGKGLGRIEWRVNGVTAGVMAKPAGSGPDYDVQQQLALDPGENQIEVIAYEGRNLLASLPARTTITYDGPADTVKPKLHILAIGVNAYTDQGWTPPGSSEKLAFLPLKLAVADAEAFSAEMQKAGAGLYSEVLVTLVLDADATPAKLDALIEQMADGISPRDTFVLYAAAHGYSLNGRYYLIPQDYQGGVNPEALKARAIGQERLQDWIANRIKAKKAVILLDTCESGALTGGYTKSRIDVPASEAAIGRLHEATGRPVLTAAATGKPAFEGYKGHGVFTYALMEALHQGDANNNGRIELIELAAHVQKRVPELVVELGEHGGVVKGAVLVVMRGAEIGKQSAHFGSTGEDFAVVAQLP